MNVQLLSREQLIDKYCKRHDTTIENIAARLEAMDALYQPDGYFLAECQVLDSSRLGSYVILPYGPNNTFQAPPDKPFSPRGLASDMSVVVAVAPNVKKVS